MDNEIAQKLKDAEHVSQGGKQELNITQLLLIRSAIKEIERLEAVVKELHHHLGEALYSDEWDTREYAIAAHSRYDKEPF
jgi:hypothetical protein